ncbi:MAG: hypothetical protein HY877_00230 [Deltaproteobacteria bacterium]|nr:hypothetical protein [Deltaproteobacteria bacterium]
MKKSFLVVLLGLCFSLTTAFAQTAQKCPATIVISSSNKTNLPAGDFDDIVRKAFENTFKKKWGDQIQLVAQNGDFLLKVHLTPKAETTLLSTSLTDNRTGQSLGSVDKIYTLADFKPAFKADLMTTFEKFSASLTPKIHCATTPVSGADLCLVFTADATTAIRDPETGLKFDYNYANAGEVPLSLDKASGTISGKGTMRPKTSVNLDVSKMPASGRGMAPEKAVPVTVSGKLIGETAKLHVEGSQPASFPFHSQLEGQPVPDVQYTSFQFILDIDIPFHSGGRKKESKITKPIPGYDITNTVLYDFILKPCGR